MPELPEVESVRRALLPLLVNRRVGRVEVREPRLRWPVDSAALARGLPGRRILGVRRRAKYLLLDLEGGAVLMLHLGMSGRLSVVPARRRLARHDHVIVALNGGRQLRFNDARRFGVVELLPPGEESGHRLLRHLGLEPLDAAFQPAALRRAARGRRAPVKAFLMDSRQVVGIGNIYASEALHRAGVHPRRPAGRLSAARWERLAAAIRAVLRDAIHLGGTTLRDFTGADGARGEYGWRLAVYGREGEPCGRCHRSIRRTVQSGRSTFYCPGCQR